jgi:dihydroflavonol-4-reductase
MCRGGSSNWQVRFVALFSAAARQTATNLGKRRNASSDKSRRVFGWSLRSSEKALLATAESMIRFGLLKHQQTAP